jgi:hypothetical protein
LIEKFSTLAAFNGLSAFDIQGASSGFFSTVMCLQVRALLLAQLNCSSVPILVAPRWISRG